MELKLHIKINIQEQSTVRRSHSGKIAFLSYNSRVNQTSLKRLKSTPNLIFFTYISKNRLDLSKEVLWFHFGQEGSKLQDLKVCAGQGSNPDRPKTKFTVAKSRKT